MTAGARAGMATPSACCASHPQVMGRCGRDTGHDGPHRSTGATFTAEWDHAEIRLELELRRPPPPRYEPLPDPVIPST